MVTVLERPKGVILKRGQANFENTGFDSSLSPWVNDDQIASGDTLEYALESGRSVARSVAVSAQLQRYFYQAGSFYPGMYTFTFVINNRTNTADGGLIGITAIGSHDLGTWKVVSNNDAGFVTDVTVASNAGQYQVIEFTVRCYEMFPYFGFYIYRSGGGLTENIDIAIDSIGLSHEQCIDATITEEYGNSVNINSAGHGLSDGDYIYIESNIEDYNGFWPVQGIDGDNFTIEQYPDGPYVPYIVDANITYCPGVSTHGWSCVHLPIVYRLSNTRFPVNSEDTARTISSFTNDNGYVNLNLSGSLGTFEDLSFIKISNAPNSDFNGVYQIIDKLATNDVTINLSSSVTTNHDIVGATVQLYYSSYVINVNVYGGLNSSHQWSSQKPYELIATLQLVPDANNQVKFSIAESLKSQIETKSNLLGSTMPNDITQFTMFYIEYWESYDTSDGYVLSTTDGTVTIDQSTFEGVAVNAALPFKNIHSGYLSEYIMTNITAKFLTLFAIPVLFSCEDEECYQDISFLNEFELIEISLRQEYYSDGSIQATVDKVLGEIDRGLIRAQLDNPNCDYDRVDLTVLLTGINISSFTSYNNADIGGINWVSGVSSLDDSNVNSNYYYVPFFFQSGVTYTISYEITIAQTGSWDSSDFTASLSKSKSGAAIVQDSDNFSSDGAHSGSFSLTPDETHYGFLRLHHFFSILAHSGSATSELTIDSISVSFSDQEISETKQLDIDCNCANQNLRLMWLNYLDGFDYWNFTAEKDHTVNIEDSGETKTNIFPNWPKSYGEFANTIDKQTFRDSRDGMLVRAKNVTLSQLQGILHIRTSPLVQIVTSRKDTRTVIVDTDSFTSYADGDKTFTIQFNIKFTNRIPSQRI